MVAVEEDIQVSEQLQGSVSYFQYELPDEGMTLRLNVAAGRVVLYASTRVQNPNSALYDLRLETESTEDIFISPRDFVEEGEGGGDTDSSMAGVGRRRINLEERERDVMMIFVTVEGLEQSNSYVLETTLGDTSTSELLCLKW